MDAQKYTARIVANIADDAVNFTNEVMGEALSKWGYKREDVEAAMRELGRYRALGTVKELAGHKSFFEAISTLPGCNTCAAKAGCNVKTRPGEYERINCHLHEL